MSLSVDTVVRFLGFVCVLLFVLVQPWDWFRMYMDDCMGDGVD